MIAFIDQQDTKNKNKEQAPRSKEELERHKRVFFLLGKKVTTLPQGPERRRTTAKTQSARHGLVEHIF